MTSLTSAVMVCENCANLWRPVAQGLFNYEYSLHSNEYNRVDIFSKFEQNLAGKIFVTY